MGILRHIRLKGPSLHRFVMDHFGIEGVAHIHARLGKRRAFNGHAMDKTGDVISFPVVVDYVAPKLENNAVSAAPVLLREVVQRGGDRHAIVGVIERSAVVRGKVADDHQRL